MPDFNDPQKNNVVVIDFERKPKKNVLKPQGHANNQKRDLFVKVLAKGVVSVVLDACAPGVKVPPRYQATRDLVLNFSYDFHIPDFNFNDVAIWATLSFDEGEFFCWVPWSSVLGIFSALPPKEEHKLDILLEDESSSVCLPNKNNIIAFDFMGNNSGDID